MGFALKATTRVFPTAPKSALEGQKPPHAVAAPKPVKIIEPGTKIKDVRLRDPTKAGERFADRDVSNAAREGREEAKVRPVWFLPGVDDHDGAGLKEGSNFKAALPTTGESSHWAQIANEVHERIAAEERADVHSDVAYAANERLKEKRQSIVRFNADREKLAERMNTRAMEKAAAEAARKEEQNEVRNMREVRKVGQRAVKSAKAVKERLLTREEHGVPGPKEVHFPVSGAMDPEFEEYLERRIASKPTPRPARPQTRAEVKAVEASQKAARAAEHAKRTAANAAEGKGKGQYVAPPPSAPAPSSSGGAPNYGGYASLAKLNQGIATNKIKLSGLELEVQTNGSKMTPHVRANFEEGIKSMKKKIANDEELHVLITSPAHEQNTDFSDKVKFMMEHGSNKNFAIDAHAANFLVDNGYTIYRDAKNRAYFRHTNPATQKTRAVSAENIKATLHAEGLYEDVPKTPNKSNAGRGRPRTPKSAPLGRGGRR